MDTQNAASDTPDAPVIAPLHRTPYPFWLASNTATTTSMALLGFAVPLLALMITNDPVKAGVIAAVTVIARLVATLVGGVLADRHSRGRIMIIGGIVSTVFSAAFTALAVTGSLTFTTLLVTSVVMGFSSTVFDMASEPMLKDILPSALVGRAKAANQGRDAALSLGAGPFGGLLLGVGGWLVGLAMTVIDAVALVSSALLVRRARRLDAPAPPAEAEAPGRRGGGSAFREVGAAFRWLWRRTDLMNITVIVTLINLGLGVIITTTIYALQQHGATPAVIGLVSAGSGVGVLVGAIGAGWAVRHIPTGTIAVAGLSLVVVGTAVLTVVSDPWGVAIVLACTCVVVPPVNASLGGYTMVATPSAMLGRVNSATAVLGGIVAPLAPLVAGVGLATIGRTPTILIGCVFTIASVILMLSTKPTRTIPVDTGWEAHAAAFDRAA
ncbi:MFS transporter [Microbacterium gorillae]|uniref:MFS transporter n=1 Tax=Microbacterium gorillae TaxID=1231063 RepID=UPI0006933E4C|nr:MFS transporter [Microbacterium gorillae]